jgi:hypothetical protein
MSRKRKSDPLPTKKGPTNMPSSGTDPATSGEELEKIIGAIHGKHKSPFNPSRQIQEENQGTAEEFRRADAKDCRWCCWQHPAAYNHLRIPNVTLFGFTHYCYLGKRNWIH